MFKNYLKITLRSLAKNKLHTTINIFGLAIGFVVATLSILYIRNELSYEKWIPNQEDIYRVYRQGVKEDAGGWVYTPRPLARTLAEDIAGVKKATNLFLEKEILFTKGEKAIYVKDVAKVDSSFFDVFAFPFQAGNQSTAMDEQYGMVISERIAELFFGASNPIGETLKYGGETVYMITGVMKAPEGSTYLSHEVYLSLPDNIYSSWVANRVTTYIQKEKKAAIHEIGEKTDQFLLPIYKKEMAAINMPIETNSELPKWKFQSLNEIHLYSDNMIGFRDSLGTINKLYIFGFVAFLVLLIASINYMNLATARATLRAKEVGMRKVSGAKKSQLIGQFLTESILQSLLALVVAMILSEFLLPIFRQITDRELAFFSGDFASVVFPLIGLSLLIGVLAGIYPAFFLARFEPIKILKGNLLQTADGQFFRKSLVVTQFSVSIILIILLFFIFKQVDFMQSQDLGFNGEQVLTIEMNKSDSWQKFEQRRNNFERIPEIKSISLSNTLPGQKHSIYSLDIEGNDQRTNAEVLFVSEGFKETLDLTLESGRFFSNEYATDAQNAFVVNEKFIQENNIKTPIEQGIKLPGDNTFGQIIGVVKDFHTNGLQEKIKPLVMTARINREYYKCLALKLQTTELRSTIAAIKREWATIEPAHPLRYSFLNENFAIQYKENERFGRMMLYATGLTIFIAMLGLFGLASFMAERRTKEIGVRKVLGATVFGLVNLLVKDFIKLVVVAGLIAIPISYWLVGKWLEDFAYTTSITTIPFVVAIIMAVLLAVLTVSYQSIKVSTENPVKALKVE